MNRKKTEQLTDSTKEALERAGYTLVGLGAYLADAARSKDAPDALIDAGRAIARGIDRVEHRGRSALPHARKAAEDAGDRVKTTAQSKATQARDRATGSVTQAKQKASESAQQARRQATDTASKARTQATETGDQLRKQVRDAMTYLRDVSEAKTGVHPNYTEMTKDELYERAQSRDIEGRSEMDKDELVEALRRDDNPDFESMTKDELYELASTADIEGRSKMSKPQLVKALNQWLAEQRELVNA